MSAAWQQALRPKSRGFTLVEVLVALSIFVGFFAAVPALLVSTIRANDTSRELTTALNLARDRIEQLRASGGGTLALGTFADAQPLTETGANGGHYNRNWEVLEGPAPGTREVRVTVTWNHAGASRSARLRTILTNFR